MTCIISQPTASCWSVKADISAKIFFYRCMCAADDSSVADAPRGHPHLLRHFSQDSEENRRSPDQQRGDDSPVAARVAGNIRQLENAVYRAVVMSTATSSALPISADAAERRRLSAWRHSEPSSGPGFFSTAPAMVSGNEIPSRRYLTRDAGCPTTSGEVRPLELETRLSVRDLTLSRADVRSRAPVENRPLDALPQAR